MLALGEGVLIIISQAKRGNTLRTGERVARAEQFNEPEFPLSSSFPFHTA